MENGKTTEGRLLKRDVRLNQKLEQAKNPNSIIVISRTKRVTTLINLLTQTDIALSRVQNNIGDSIPVDKAVEMFDKFNKFITEIEAYTIDALKLTNGRYFESAALKSINSKSAEQSQSKKSKSKEGARNE